MFLTKIKKTERQRTAFLSKLTCSNTPALSLRGFTSEIIAIVLCHSKRAWGGSRKCGNLPVTHSNGPLSCCLIGFWEQRNGFDPKWRMNPQHQHDSENVAKGHSFLTILKSNWKGGWGLGDYKDVSIHWLLFSNHWSNQKHKTMSQCNCEATCAKKLLTITLV